MADDLRLIDNEDYTEDDDNFTSDNTNNINKNGNDNDTDSDATGVLLAEKIREKIVEPDGEEGDVEMKIAPKKPVKDKTTTSPLDPLPSSTSSSTSSSPMRVRK